MKKSAKKNKGITLIALVITIIVLLILAGITIASLSGNNGILTRAADAKEKTNKEQTEEIIKIGLTEILMDKNLEKGTFEELLKAKFGTENIRTNYKYYIVKNNGYEVLIDINGNIIGETELEGIIKFPIPGNPEEEGFFRDKSTIDGEKEAWNNPIIPAGFRTIDTETSKWKENSNKRPTENAIKNGLVIQDKNKAEFVWVTVKNIEEMVGKDGPENKDYFGILYDFTSNTEYKAINTKRVKNGYREPDILEKDISQNITMESLQDEFNKMSISTEKYGGFYIGRYESSFINNENFGAIAPIKGKNVATADVPSANTWYGLYNKQKLYKVGEVKGGMIWGSQYDAMLRWLVENNIDVTSVIPKKGKAKNETLIAGNEPKDELCNIYDLLGSRREFTLEAFITNVRVYRSGYNSNSFSLNYRNTYDSTGSYCSTRATLYIP